MDHCFYSSISLSIHGCPSFCPFNHIHLRFSFIGPFFNLIPFHASVAYSVGPSVNPSVHVSIPTAVVLFSFSPMLSRGGVPPAPTLINLKYQNFFSGIRSAVVVVPVVLVVVVAIGSGSGGV